MEPLVVLAAVAVFIGALVLLSQLFKHDAPEDPDDQLTPEETQDLLSND